MRYKLIMLDLDGTLLTSSEQISPRNIAVLERAYNQGIHICIATGRMIKTATTFTGPLTFPHTLAVCNGALITLRPDNTLLSRNYLKQKDIHTILRYLHKLGSLERLDVITDDIWYTRPLTQAFIDQSRRFKFNPGEIQLADTGDIRLVTTGEKAFALGIPRVPAGSDRSKKASKIMARLSKQQAPTFFREIASQLSDYEITLSSPTLLEIMAPGAGKGQAMLKVTQHLGLDPSQVIAFGDQMNDMDMLQKAGLGVAMENATEHVKNIADAVAGHHNEDGVAVFLERLLDSV